MQKWKIGILATWAFCAAATPAVAQTRPHVSSSESSRQSEPTCVVNGGITDCDGSSAVGMTPLAPGPVIVGAFPVLGPVLGGQPVLGRTSGGHADTDTDVQRSTHYGSAVAR
jgi:hypothetical protein